MAEERLQGNTDINKAVELGRCERRILCDDSRLHYPALPIHAERVPRHATRHQRLAQTEHRVDDALVSAKGDWVERIENARNLRIHHFLYEDSHTRLAAVLLQTHLLPVQGGAWRPQGAEALHDSLDQFHFGGDIDARRVDTGKAGMAEVFQGRRASHGHSLKPSCPIGCNNRRLQLLIEFDLLTGRSYRLFAGGGGDDEPSWHREASPHHHTQVQGLPPDTGQITLPNILKIDDAESPRHVAQASDCPARQIRKRSRWTRSTFHLYFNCSHSGTKCSISTEAGEATTSSSTFR